ncbi:hypothetical protein BASA81_012465 [Batrachochytrium salamandrivorans]|nr:hypothetical protein BASA81_012465 [Batrachochytrium salamandrivorans]
MRGEEGGQSKCEATVAMSSDIILYRWTVAVNIGGGVLECWRFCPLPTFCTSGCPRSALKPRSRKPQTFRFRSESTSGSAPTRPGF